MNIILINVFLYNVKGILSNYILHTHKIIKIRIHLSKQILMCPELVKERIMLKTCETKLIPFNRPKIGIFKILFRLMKIGFISKEHEHLGVFNYFFFDKNFYLT